MSQIDAHKHDSDNLHKIRHSAEHVLTQAMYQLYGNDKFYMAMGPATDDGFYFDFEPLNSFKISEEDFPKIEAEMTKIIKENLPIIREEITLDQAKELFKDNPYKLEWLDSIKDRNEIISIYKTADAFVDLCAGPHLAKTGEIKAFKLLSVAGAYWHGDEKNKMLTRIYGTAFESQKNLDQFLWQIEEAKKRDHRKIGKELDLFSFHPEAPADVFWHNKGYIIMREMFTYWRQIHEREGYQEVRTPEILSNDLWQQSGHLKSFSQKMYKVSTPDSKEWNMSIKPMNCDGGILIYKSNPKSYRDFPLKVGELGIVHRYESSGEVHGIIRPREFTQDDAHIYCTPDQVKEEIKKVMDLCFEIYNTYGLKLDHLELSTRPQNSIGSDEVWEKAESIMRQILTEGNTPYQINEGDGAFYGPKFDFHLKDCVGRTWQCSTIQLDFAQPQNFNLEYTAEDGTKQQPVMIHRVLYGSVERFLGIVIENCAGAFPLWLSPLQAKIIPITDAQHQYANKILSELKEQGIRAEIDDRSEKMQAKIRDAQMKKVPYMLIIGNREVESNSVSVRQRDGQDLGAIPFVEFLAKVKEQINTRSLNLIK
ncbi:MAG: threonine--tRNA ligase [Candidatus Shapirobacteria bacterium]|nr:threonine--tRNA ligase [Candidatus Shapirobacteria bacterium]